jgi:hypothetical protein
VFIRTLRNDTTTDAPSGAKAIERTVSGQYL